MKIAKIYKYLDEGGKLDIEATGVTFKSEYDPSVNKQANIKLMRGSDTKDLTLNHDKDNEFDDFALEILYNNLDVGYIPKNKDIQVTTVNGRDRRAYIKGVNKMLIEYNGELKCTLKKVYGGYSGKHCGFSVEVRKA